MAPSPLNFVFNCVLTYILSLYAKPHYPLKMVQQFIDFFINFIRDIFLENLKQDVFAALKNENLTSTAKHNINKCFEKYGSVFDPLSSHKKRETILRTKGFLDAEEIHIGTVSYEKVVNNESVLAFRPLYGVYVPLKKSFQLFLEIPGLFNETLTYMEKLMKNNSVISNIIQGDLWKRMHPSTSDQEIILPYFIFYDDLETGNTLGSHAGSNKLGAIYALIACLPSHIASRLSSILFCTLIYTEDKKESENKLIFGTLIKEINFLRRTGINIMVNNIARRVKFQLVLILGDNLGLNGILGFVESFTANHPCRVCKMPRIQLKKAVKEIPELLRNRSNYDVDCLLNKTSITGIKEPCVFNEIDNFHVTENISVDMMHDVLEGVCLYTLKKLLIVFIYRKKYFTLQMFNDLVQKFEYGPIESGNKPPKITPHRLKDDDDTQLNLSAAEMLCLTRYLGMIIGHLVPRQEQNAKPNDHWNLYKLLRQIIDLVTNPRITRSDKNVLEDLVIEFNNLYLKLFGDLKPKFHFLIHYPRLLLENGPFTVYWTMRYESKHTEIKASAQSTSSTRNLAVTIANKQMYKMCHLIHSLQFENILKLSSPIEMVDHLLQIFGNDIVCYEKIEIFGTVYRKGMFVVLNIEASEKQFGEITNIIKQGNKVFFECMIYEEIIFEDHFHAYLVQSTNVRKCYNYKNLPVKQPCLGISKNNDHYVATRFSL